MKKLLTIISLTLALTACASGGRVSLEQGDAMMRTDKWTTVDTNNAIKDIMEQLSTHPSFVEYTEQLGRKPKLYIQKLENSTADPHFRTAELNNAFLKALSRSGKFVLINMRNQDEIGKALAEQRKGRVRKEDILSAAKLLGADMAIFGQITNTPNISGRQRVNEYTATVSLTILESSEEFIADHTETKFTKASIF